MLYSIFDRGAQIFVFWSANSDSTLNFLPRTGSKHLESQIQVYRAARKDFYSKEGGLIVISSGFLFESLPGS